MAFASKDRAALQALNEAAHAAVRALGRDHPLFARALFVMRETDAMVDEIAPAVAEGLR